MHKPKLVSSSARPCGITLLHTAFFYFSGAPQLWAIRTKPIQGVQILPGPKIPPEPVALQERAVASMYDVRYGRASYISARGPIFIARASWQTARFENAATVSAFDRIGAHQYSQLAGQALLQLMV